MKNLTLIIMSILISSFYGYSQAPKDSSKKQVNKIEKRIIVMSNESGDEDIMIDANNPMCGGEMDENCRQMCKDRDEMEGPCQQMCNKHMKFDKKFNHKNAMFFPNAPKHLSLSKKALVLLPVFLFLFFVVIILFWLRRENFRLSDALSSRAPEVIRTNCTKTDPNDPSKTITEVKEELFYHRSSSRLLALLAGVTALIIAVCAITIHIYFALSQSAPPMKHHGGMAIILIALGICMIPYAVKTMFKK